MPRAKKDGKYVNIYMDRTILDAMDAYSAETHIPKTAIIEEGVKLYLETKGIRIDYCNYVNRQMEKSQE